MMSNVSNPLGTWITLSEAAQYAVRLGGVDERIAALMDADTWALEARRKIHCGDWLAEMEAELGKAEDLLRSLRAGFRAGKVAGESAHVGPGSAQARTPIAESEWETSYAHFWRNELQPKAPGEHFRFPRIVAVRVRTEDVRREVERELAARRSATPIVDLHGVIRKAVRANGGYLSLKHAFEIARKAGAIEEREEIRQAVRDVIGRQISGPKGPRKNRADPPA
jgi:hypothetical protein